MDVHFRFRNNKEGLFKAVEHNQLSEIRRLIKNGINVNTKDENGWTPLMIAADKNNLQVVKLLIELGADLEIKNDDEETALMISAYSNSGYVSRHLISIGANPNIEDKNGRTAYDIAKELFPTQNFEYLLPKNKKKKIKDNGENKFKEESEKKNILLVRMEQNKSELLKKEIFFNDFFYRISKNDNKENIIQIEELRNSFMEEFNTELKEEDFALYFGYHKKLREKLKRLENGDFQIIHNHFNYVIPENKSYHNINNLNHDFSVESSDVLKKMGATWFVSYAYFEKVDFHHENWNSISTVKSRISWFESSRKYHKSWLFHVLLMDDARLNTNWIGLSASDVKRMAQEIIIKCKYNQ